MALLRSRRVAAVLFDSFRSVAARRSYSQRTSERNDIKKSVFVSQSTNVHTNLALEEWLYRNFDFTNHHVLLLSRNDPCVVIGRRQNPWLETNVTGLHDAGKVLARRGTGGGSYYNDLGSLNLTFFTPNERHDAAYDREIIVRGIFRRYGLKVNVSDGENLSLRNSKNVSANASQLGQPNSYHQCTLLIETNKADSDRALRKQEKYVTTGATGTVPVQIMNLCDENPKINVVGVLEAIGWEYMRTSALAVQDGGLSLANRQNGFQMINPTDAWFPGLGEIRNELAGWDWCYGSTPKFNVTHALHHNAEFQVSMEVNRGRIRDASINTVGFQAVIQDLIGSKYTDDALDKLESFVGECNRQEIMTSM